MMGAGYFSKKQLAAGRNLDVDSYFYHKAVWVERFAWTPKRCELTHKWVWLRKVMMGVAMWTGTGDPIIEYRWHGYREHIIWILKK